MFISMYTHVFYIHSLPAIKYCVIIFLEHKSDDTSSLVTPLPKQFQQSDLAPKTVSTEEKNSWSQTYSSQGYSLSEKRKCSSIVLFRHSQGFDCNFSSECPCNVAGLAYLVSASTCRKPTRSQNCSRQTFSEI